MSGFFTALWSEERIGAEKKNFNKNKKSQRHPEFPSGLTSIYYLGQMLLNFNDRTKTGLFNLVWPMAKRKVRDQVGQAASVSQLPCLAEALR
jgi:hypothetical protein